MYKERSFYVQTVPPSSEGGTVFRLCFGYDKK